MWVFRLFYLYLDNTFSNSIIFKYPSLLAIFMPKILYVSERRSEGFATAISYRVEGYEEQLVHQVGGPDCLDGKCGVVLVGPQQDVFGDPERYFAFLRRVKDASLPVAAVIQVGMGLPHNNKDIDYIVESQRSRTTIRSIADKLGDFFDSYRERQRGHS